MALQTRKGKKVFKPALLNALATQDNDQVISKLEALDPENLVDNHGRTLLHHAAASKNHEIVRYLLDRGCEVDAKDEVGSTPLILAVVVAHTPTIEILLDADADVFVTDSRLRNPARMAFAIDGYTDSNMASTFLAALRKRCSNDKEMLAKVLIDMKCTLPQAVLLKDVDVTKYMLKNGSTVNERAVDGTSALHIAIGKEDLPNVKLLVERGADIEAQDYLSRRPLHCYQSHSASEVNVELLRFLLEHGACPATPDGRGRTPASQIFHFGSVEIAKILLEHDVDLSMRNEQGFTLLHHAAANKNFQVIQLFVGGKFDVNARTRNAGCTALWPATVTANWRALEFLLRNGADLNVKNNEGYTILTMCLNWLSKVENRQPDGLKSVELLLQHAMNRPLVYQEHKVIFGTLLRTTTSIEFAKLLLAYLAIKGPAENVLSTINARVDYKSYYDECERKIKEMKNTVVYGAVTLFKFLIDDEEQLVLYARNQETFARLKAVVAAENAKSDFYLVRLLLERIERAVHTAALRGKAAASLERIMGSNCDEVVIDKILPFLDDASLNNLSQIQQEE